MTTCHSWSLPFWNPCSRGRLVTTAGSLTVLHFIEEEQGHSTTFTPKSQVWGFVTPSGRSTHLGVGACFIHYVSEYWFLPQEIRVLPRFCYCHYYEAFPDSEFCKTLISIIFRWVNKELINLLAGQEKYGGTFHALRKRGCQWAEESPWGHR